tara:strand:+ start:1310 stop:1780 length:471 start_codon:yes stop_codon:yes gene_type:complete
MKKLTLSIGLIASLMMVSCERNDNNMRVRGFNYSGNLENPTGIPQMPGSIMVEIGTPCEEVIKKIREWDYPDLDFSDTVKYPNIFLDPYYYDETYHKEPNPDYMLFPHAISSTQDKWGWEYYYEYCEIGEQAFCDKYFNGKRTLGMKLKQVQGYKP